MPIDWVSNIPETDGEEKMHWRPLEADILHHPPSPPNSRGEFSSLPELAERAGEG